MKKYLLLFSINFLFFSASAQVAEPNWGYLTTDQATPTANTSAAKQPSNSSVKFKLKWIELKTDVMNRLPHRKVFVGEDDEEGENEKYDGPEQAAMQNFEAIKDPALGYVPTERLLTALDATVFSQNVVMGNNAVGNTTPLPTLTWGERGPNYDVLGASNGNSRANSGIAAGRVRAILVDANDATKKTVFIGGVDGGLWKTTDITATSPTWTLVNDYFSNMAIAAITQDPTTPNTMYFCTGESYFNADAVRGVGVFKSTDGGVTWNVLASTSSFVNGTRILCDYLGNVYLATRSTGLRRSTNGGTTWSADLTPSGLTSDICDMEISSTTAAGRLHIVTGIFSTQAYRYTDVPTTVSSSAGWTAPTTAFTSAVSNRAEIACSDQGAGAASACTLYALPANASHQVPTIYKSTDGGANWITTGGVPSATWASGQGWYALSVDINPSNAAQVIIGGLDTWKSTNSGSTWTQLSTWVGTTPVNQYVHADVHKVLWYDGGNKLIFGSDGGIFYSSDGGTTIRDRNTGLRIKQFYSCAIHPSTTNYFLAGAQDNGVHQFNNAGLSNTVEVTGGDGAFVAIDQDQPQYQFGSYIYNQYRRSTNSGATWSSVNLSSSAGQFINPIDYDNTANIMYCGDASASYRRWTNPQSGSTNAVVGVSNMTGSVTAVTVSPYTSNRVYFGTGSGKVVQVDNANTFTSGSAGINLSTGLPSGTVSCIAEGPSDNYLLAVLANYGINNIWFSTNGGTSWTACDGNLPDMPVRWAMFYPGTSGKAFIATETGVWATDSLLGASTVWTANSTFPTVRTDMIKYRSSDGTIIAATHGRGLWSTVLPTVVPPAPTAGITASSVSTCPNTAITFTDNSFNNPTSWSWTFPSGTPSSSTSQNPGSVTWSTPGTYTVSLTATNSHGSSTITTSITVLASSSLPFSEGFEGGTFLPTNWVAVSVGGAWTQANTGKSSTKSALFDNFNIQVNGARDEMHSPPLNFTSLSTAKLKFDRAHAVYGASNKDTLEVLISTNCGATWTSVYLKGYTNLATNGGAAVTGAIFVPTSAQWVTDSVILNTYVGQSSVLVNFRNRGNYGQAIYVDNVNVTGVVAITPPVAAFTPSATSVCAGVGVNFTDNSTNTPTSWSWTFPSGTPATSSSQNPTGVTWSVGGTYTVSFTATNAGGGNTTTQNITVTGNVTPSVSISPSVNNVCSGTSVTITATPTFGGGAPTYNFKVNGTSVQNSSSATYTSTAFANGDVVTCVMTANNTCQTSSTANSGNVTMVINPLPNVGINISPSSTVCVGTSVTLSGTGASSYTYTGGVTNGFAFNAASSATYTVTGTDANSCVNTNTRTLTVMPLPTVNAIGNQSVCAGLSTSAVSFSGTGTQFNWTNNTTSIGLAASGSGNISAFTTVNATSSPVTATVSVTPAKPAFAYIPNYTSNNISVINTSTNAVLTTITVGTHPFGLCITPDGSKVYVENNGSNNVSVINTATNTVTATIPVGSYPSGVASNSDGSKVYVANYTSNSVSVITTASNTVTATVTVGTNPYGVVVHPNDSKIYVANYLSNTVSVINATTNTVTNTITVGTNPYGVCLSPNGGLLYVSNNGSNNVSVINTYTNTVITTISVASTPTGLAITPNGNTLYVTQNGASTVAIINTTTNLVTGSIMVGTAPLGISASSDGSKMYVANGSSNNMSVIATATNTVTVTVTVGTDPYAFGNFVQAEACSGTAANFNIVVNPLPTVGSTATPSATICTGTSVTLNGTGATSYSWSGSVTNNVSFTPASSGSYTVTGTDGNGCINTAIQSITLTPNVTPSVSIAASVNNICSGTSVTITATPTNGGGSPTYNFLKNNISVQNTSSNTFTSTSFANNDSIKCIITANNVCQTTATATSNKVTMILSPNLTPVVSIAASVNNICSGTSVTITATPTNGGGSPTYNFLKNNISVQNNSSPTYTTTSFANNDSIKCIITANNVCQTTATATSGKVTMIVSPNLTPSVSIAASVNNICSGTSVTITATPTNGGGSPTYNFLKNNVSVQNSSSATYTSTTFANNDSIRCIITANNVCQTTATATSNKVTMIVSPNLTPSVSIAASVNNICAGTSVTLTATPTNGGGSPTYNFLKNNVSVQNNSSATYTSTSFANNDSIRCIVTANNTCQTTATATSNKVTMIITTSAVWYQDFDADGFGNLSVTQNGCVQPTGYVSNSSDCNDAVAAINPNTVWFMDADGDHYYVGSGVTQCTSPGLGYAYTGLLGGNDCNDNNILVYQSANLFTDVDGDGYTVGTATSVCYGASIPTGYAVSSLGTDCNDNNNLVYQSANLFTDVDGDGYTVGTATSVCYGAAIPTGYAVSSLGTDCNDNNNLVYQSSNLFTDADGDGYTIGTATSVCYGASIPTGYAVSSVGTDCNDNNSAVHPGATEICNGIDDNCNGAIDEGCAVNSLAPQNDNPCSSLNASSGSGQVAGYPTMLSAYDNGGALYNGVTNNPTANPPSGPNLIYYNGSTVNANSLGIGEPVPPCGTFGLSPKTVWYKFRAPTMGGIDIYLRSGYASTTFSTILSAYILSGSPCTTAATYTNIGCSTNGTLFLPSTALTAYGGQDIYVQLAGVNSTAGTYLLSLQGVPQSLSLSNPTTASLAVNLPSVAGATSVTLRWAAVTGSGYSQTPISPSVTNYTITGLSSGVNYKVWAAYTNAVQTFYSLYTVIGTTVGCSLSPVAPTVTVVPGHCSRATVIWPAHPLAATVYPYRLYWRVVGASGFNVIAATTNSYNITGLALNTSYEFFYKVICTGGGQVNSLLLSPYTTCAGPAREGNPNTNNFANLELNGREFINADFITIAQYADNTEADGDVHEIILNEVAFENAIQAHPPVAATVGTFNIVPNPVIDEVQVQYHLTNELPITIRILNIDGRMITEKEIATPGIDGSVYFNLNQLQAGVYLVNIAGDELSVTKRLVLMK